MTSAATSALWRRRSASVTCFPAGDGLSDRPCSDDDDDFAHCETPYLLGAAEDNAEPAVMIFEGGGRHATASTIAPCVWTGTASSVSWRWTGPRHPPRCAD
jgi:hypothetical protein